MTNAGRRSVLGVVGSVEGVPIRVDVIPRVKPSLVKRALRARCRGEQIVDAHAAPLAIVVEPWRR